MGRTAVVLLNLGGPDQLESVQPFLRNLFRDPAILRLPGIFREPLAWLIARKRSREAQAIYAHLGGGSPLLKNTQAQAQSLEKRLGRHFRVFIAMRYWHPFTEETVREVLAYRPGQVILLPLYPQFSTTTTASSLKCWSETTRKMGLNVSTRTIGCYPAQRGFVRAVAELLDETLQKVDDLSQTHVLFSAHGLPKRIIEAGDPYQKQVEQTVQAVMDEIKMKERGCVYSIAYQSRVGPLEWIGPATDGEIKRLGRTHKNVVLVPISFVSEHSETLYELDYQYKILAEASGVNKFFRVPTVGIHPEFIEGLAELCCQDASHDDFVCSQGEENCFCQGVNANV